MNSVTNNKHQMKRNPSGIIIKDRALSSELNNYLTQNNSPLKQGQRNSRGTVSPSSLSTESIKNYCTQGSAAVESLEMNPEHLLKVINQQKKVMHMILQEKIEL